MRATVSRGIIKAWAVLLAGSVTATALPQTGAVEKPQAGGCTLRIRVDGLRNGKGNIGTVVFRSPDGWPEDNRKAFRVGPAPIDPNGHGGTAVWRDLPAGDYGVAAIHDENSNAKLDRNFLGIPKEGFGFANNPRVIWGPAPFKEAIVHVGCPETETTIHMLYK
jgi:uncharacterized protein (DUF2141 family)